MLFLEGESVWRRTEGRCPLPEPCRGRCSGTLSTSQACTTGPPLKTTLQKQTEKGKGQRTLPSAPSLPGQPWGEGWVWKEVGPGGMQRHGAPRQRGSSTPKKQLHSGKSLRGFTANLRPWYGCVSYARQNSART